MKGPFRRIRLGRRPADDPGQQQDPQATLVVPPVAAPTDATAVQAAVESPAAAPTPPEPLPAGMTPADVAPTRPSFRDRGRLRRRLRYLRRVRELGFRDLGGLAFDLHRFRRRNDELVLGKLAALDAVDRELRAIERVLNDRRDIVELREPGIAACPRCGALHGSDANFCPQCGTQFSGPRAIGEVGGQPTPPEVSPAQETLPISAAEQGSSPVSGALAGNPPAEAPTVAEGVGGEVAAGEAAAGGEASTAGGSAPAGDGPAGSGVAAGDGATTAGEAAATSGDPATTEAGEPSAAGDESSAAGDPSTPAASDAALPGDAPATGDAPAAGAAPNAIDPDAPTSAAHGEPAANDEAAAADQPTQAFPALGEENGHGSAMTGGDPLASRERSAE